MAGVCAEYVRRSEEIKPRGGDTETSKTATPHCDGPTVIPNLNGGVRTNRRTAPLDDQCEPESEPHGLRGASATLEAVAAATGSSGARNWPSEEQLRQGLAAASRDADGNPPGRRNWFGEPKDYRTLHLRRGVAAASSVTAGAGPGAEARGQPPQSVTARANGAVGAAEPEQNSVTPGETRVQHGVAGSGAQARRQSPQTVTARADGGAGAAETEPNSGTPRGQRTEAGLPSRQLGSSPRS